MDEYRIFPTQLLRYLWDYCERQLGLLGDNFEYVFGYLTGDLSKFIWRDYTRDLDDLGANRQLQTSDFWDDLVYILSFKIKFIALDIWKSGFWGTLGHSFPLSCNFSILTSRHFTAFQDIFQEKMVMSWKCPEIIFPTVRTYA